VSVTFSASIPSSIALNVSPEVLPADGVTQAGITAIVKDAQGNPAPQGTVVNFSTNIGTISNITTTTNGQATAKVKSDTAGTALITASCQGVGGLISANVSLTFTTLKITLTANPTSIKADGLSTSIINAEVKKMTLTGLVPVVNGTTVRFTTDRGEVNPVTAATSGGTVSTTLKSSSMGGTATVIAQALPGDNPTPYDSDLEARGTAEVIFTPYGPSTVTVSANPGSIPADGASITSLTAELKDINGQPVADGTYVYFTSSDPSSLLSPEFDLVLNPSGVSARKTTVGGLAGVTLRSSTTAQTVTINAIYDNPADDNNNPNDPVYGVLGTLGTKIKGSCQVTFSGGGVAEITLAAVNLNVHGWDYCGNKTTITAFLTDSNHSPVADGTEVHFTTD
ncbi:MAG: hypothetical protein COS84_02380, partial [Armatimonadetes bacterium CG07_land_8_20_14_0_80_40_9]